MTITRARKNPTKPSQATASAPVEVLAERFIEQAEAPATVGATAADAMPAKAAATADRPLPEPAAVSAAHHDARQKQAEALVKGYLPWAAGAGVLPYPGVNLAAVIAVQLRMLSQLSEHYGVTFKASMAKSVAATLLATVLEGTLAGGARSLLMFVPVVGSAITMVALPALATAGTYALGRVFISHFEAGGTFLDFQPKRVEAHFRQEFERVRLAGAA